MMPGRGDSCGTVLVASKVILMPTECIVQDNASVPRIETLSKDMSDSNVGGFGCCSSKLTGFSLGQYTLRFVDSFG